MKIIINYKLDNWNDTIAHCRGNKYGANKQKQREMAIKKYPIKIECIWHVTNCGSDLDNKSLKAVLDQMQKMGILENDNIKHIPVITHVAIKDKREYLELNIENM